VARSTPTTAAAAIPSCAGHSKHRDADGGLVPCRQYRMRGQNKCKMHGGATRQAKAAAAERIAAEKAAAMVVTYGIKVETTPTEAILEEVKWSAGHVAWLRDRVQELEQDALKWGTTKEKTGGDDWGSTSEAKPHIFVVLYQQERDRLIKVCAAAISAGLEERRVRLAEQQGALVADVIKAILADLGLTAEQQAKVPEVVPRHLRLLAGGG
jgi:hypothetical protein